VENSGDCAGTTEAAQRGVSMSEPRTATLADLRHVDYVDPELLSRWPSLQRAVIAELQERNEFLSDLLGAEIVQAVAENDAQDDDGE